MIETINRDDLYEQYNQLLHYILKPFKKMRSPLYDYDDLFQVACVAMLEAYAKYDAKKSDFVTFLYSYVRGRVKQFINSNSSSYSYRKRAVNDKIRDREIRLDSIANLADVRKASSLEELVGGIEDDRTTFEIIDVAKKAVETYWPSDRYERAYEIWYRVYINGESQTDVCKDYGISKQRVNQIIKPINSYIGEVYFEREV